MMFVEAYVVAFGSYVLYTYLLFSLRLLHRWRVAGSRPLAGWLFPLDTWLHTHFTVGVLELHMEWEEIQGSGDERSISSKGWG